jgi:hypothetical protein
LVSQPIFRLYPHRLGDAWRADHRRTAPRELVFVAETANILTRLVEAREIPQADFGFVLHFSSVFFDGYDVVLRRRHEDEDRTTYGGDVFGQWMAGDLCSDLFYAFFTSPPKRLYVAARPCIVTADPRWEREAGWLSDPEWPGCERTRGA